MPSVPLESAGRDLSSSAVVARYGNATLQLVGHAAILRSAAKVAFGESCEVYHMCPPIKQNATKVHVAGWIKLTEDEASSILTHATMLKDENGTWTDDWDCYAVGPHDLTIVDTTTKVARTRKLSCVTFVQECYSAARIQLLDMKALPAVGWDELTEVFPYLARERDTKDGNARLTKIGLPGTGPFKVAMPGYLLHALNRSDEDVRKSPYTPAAADKVFPVPQPPARNKPGQPL